MGLFVSVPRRGGTRLCLFESTKPSGSQPRSPGGDALVDFIGWWLSHSPIRTPSLGSVARASSNALRSRKKGRLFGDPTPVVSREELDAVVDVLATALELRVDGTGQHARRVTDLAFALATDVVPGLAADPQLRYGFLLHDIGLIGVPERILHKPQGLTSAETQHLEQHPILGAELVTGTAFFGETVRDVVAFHHERWDGTGYPWGLADEQIPIAARIFAIADSFEAMTSDRPYRRAMPLERALSRLQSQAGHQLDPRLVDRFLPLAVEHEAQSQKSKRHLRAA